MTNPRIAIDITTNDRSGKGVASAEKRIGTIPKHAGVANRRMLEDGERSVGRSSRGILRTLGSVEQASARVFGGRSITGGLTSRIGALGEVASTTGGELRAAASAGGLLEGAAAGVGVAIGATIGILAAAGYAAFKLADGWAKGAASIGRTAETIGVGTKALQEFTAAGERVGVDKGAAAGALGGLSQTLNDARYGRNASALAILGRLGIGMKTNANGTIDVGAMLPAIADAIARQNSSGQRTAARGLGIGLDSLAIFRQGGKALSADMADADTHAVVIDQAGIDTGKRIARRGAMVGQLTDLAMSRVGEVTATTAEGGYDAVLKGGTALADGAVSFGGIVKQTFAPAADKIASGGRAIERAAGIIASRIKAAVPSAHAAEARYGVPASVQLAQYQLESSAGRNMPRGSNNPFGIKARTGEPFVLAPTREVINGRSERVMARFRKFNSIADAFDAHARLLATGRAMSAARRHGYDVDAYVEDLGHGTRANPRYATDPKYGRMMRSIIHGGHLTDFDHGHGDIPVKVEVELKNAPPGTRVKATAGRTRPAVSHAMTKEY